MLFNTKRGKTSFIYLDYDIKFKNKTIILKGILIAYTIENDLFISDNEHC